MTGLARLAILQYQAKVNAQNKQSRPWPTFYMALGVLLWSQSFNFLGSN